MFQLRLLVLAGWKKSETGLLPVSLYFGTSGVDLQAAADAATKTGSYVAIRKIINPAGVPCPVIVDPVPQTPKVATPEAKKPVAQQTKSKAQEAHEAEKKTAEEKRLAALDKNAADMETARQGAAFAELNGKTKAQLVEMLNDINSDLPEDQRRKPENNSKVELINTILVAQGVKKPIVPNETKTNDNENENH